MSNGFQKFVIPGRPPKETYKTEDHKDVPVGFEKLTVAAEAVGLDSIPAKANKAIMTVDDATLRYRTDGGDPDADTGLRAYIGATIVLNSRLAITQFRAIKLGTASSEVNVAYYETK